MTVWVKGEVVCSVCGVTFMGVRNKAPGAPRYCPEHARQRNLQRSAERRQRFKPGSLEREAENARRRELRAAKAAAEVKAKKVKPDKASVKGHYETVSCPGDDYPEGGEMTAISFRYSLASRCYPDGMIVKRRGVTYRVRGTKLERIGA